MPTQGSADINIQGKANVVAVAIVTEADRPLMMKQGEPGIFGNLMATISFCDLIPAVFAPRIQTAQYRKARHNAQALFALRR